MLMFAPRGAGITTIAFFPKGMSVEAVSKDVSPEPASAEAVEEVALPEIADGGTRC